MEATVECWHQREEEKGCAEVDEVRKWRTNEEEKEKRSDGVVEISVEEFRELEEEIMVVGRRCMHEWEEGNECRHADDVRKVLEMAKRKAQEAEENTNVVCDAAATRHDEWTWTTTNAAEAVKHDERTRTTSTGAAEEKHDEKKSTAAAATMDKQDEKTNVAAVVGHREAPGAINLLSFRTDAAANATDKRMNLGGSLEVTVKPDSSQRRMIIETRPVRELNTLKGKMGETTEGDQTDEWTEREMRGDWGHLYGPEYCSVCGQNPFECGCLNVSFESRREKRWREERERERHRENGGDGSGEYFEGDAGRYGGIVISG